MMRILIDILHPAHVHFFKHFRTEMLERGHEVLVTAREKEVSLELLEAYDIPHITLSSQKEGRFGLATELVQRTAGLIREARRFRPDVMTGIMGPSIAPAGRLLRVPAIVFYDTEIATRTNRWVYPLATAVCTPDCYEGEVRGNHVTYPGYHELAYLHPARFSPDPRELEQYGLSEDEPFSLLRFVSWQASHDVGHSGMSSAGKLALVDRLADRGRVVISAEGPLPAELEELRLVGPSHAIHHVLAFAEIVVGDSATMSSEAAVLGTPAVFISPFRLGYLVDQARYGLVHNCEPADEAAIENAVAASLDNPPGEEARRSLMADKTDVTDWMVRYFEAAPGW